VPAHPRCNSISANISKDTDVPITSSPGLVIKLSELLETIADLQDASTMMTTVLIKFVVYAGPVFAATFVIAGIAGEATALIALFSLTDRIGLRVTALVASLMLLIQSAVVLWAAFSLATRNLGQAPSS